jgi:hypothetical protein
MFAVQGSLASPGLHSQTMLDWGSDLVVAVDAPEEQAARPAARQRTRIWRCR